MNSITFKIICSIVFMASLLMTCCEKKEPTPTVFGEWESISAIGEKWKYRVQKDGYFCQTISSQFTAWFCFQHTKSDNNLLVDKGNGVLEHYEFTFICYEVATVIVTVNGDTTQNLVLKRKD